MKVQTITVQNLKAVENAKFDLKGCTAIITAGNGKGKTSILTSLRQRANSEIKPHQVLRHNTESGFEEYVFTNGEVLRWEFDNKTKVGERLVFITTDNIKQAASKEVLQRLFPPIAFNVDEFLHDTPKEQKKTLQKISGLDLTLIDSRYDAAYNDRTYKNKQRDELKFKVKTPNPELPDEELPIEEIQQKIHGIDLHNEKHKNAKEKVLLHEKTLSETDTEIKRLTTLLNAAKSKKKEVEAKIETGKKWLELSENKPKTEEEHFKINQQLQETIDKNKKIKDNNQIKKDNKAYDDAVASAKKADQDVKAIEKEKAELIAKSKMPKGFGFTSDGGITYNGFPFNKQQLATSAIYIGALKLAALSLTEKSVQMLHFDASYLDKNSLAEIQEWANGEGLQLLIERPDFDGGEIQYQIIEDIK